MLLPSSRHTSKDLEYWAELEEADRLHCRLGKAEAKAEKARRAIETFLAAGPAYAAVSWGKDSTVVAHLVWLTCPTLPVGRVDQRGHGADPHIADVRDAFLARFPLPNYAEEAVPLTAIDDDGGHSPALDIGIKRLCGRFGTRRYIGGVRADESGVRKISMRSRGLATINACQPIGWWSDADVFAYLAHHELPVHPNYGMLGGGRYDRKWIRVSTIGGPKGTGMGRREWETEYYGDVLRRMNSR